MVPMRVFWPGIFDLMTAQMGHADWNGFFHHDTIFFPVPLH